MEIEKENKESPKTQVEYSQQEAINLSVLVFPPVNRKSKNYVLVDIENLDMARNLKIMELLATEYSTHTKDKWKTAFANDLLAKISDELERISQV